MKYALPVIAVALLLFHASNAFGHAEEPNAQTVFAVESGWVLRANFGIVSSQDPNRFVCEEAYLGGDGWLLSVLGPTEWVTFGENSVHRTTDGCQFEQVATLPIRPNDAASDPDTGYVAYLINGPESPGLYLSTDRGQTFSLYEGLDPSRHQLTSVRFLDGDTMVVGGYLRSGAVTTEPDMGTHDAGADAGLDAGLDDSEVAGASRLWLVEVETGAITPLTAPAGTTYAYVQAARSGQVLLLARRGGQVLFWGPPEDLSATELEIASWPTGATLSDDGRKAWISGTNNARGVLAGILGADGAQWETIAGDTIANCVARDGDDLLVCGEVGTNGSNIARISPDGAISSELDFRGFLGARDQCPCNSTAAGICPTVWKEIDVYFQPLANESVAAICIDDETGSDAGSVTSDSGNESNNEPDSDSPPPSSGCCATSHSDGSTGTALAAALLLLMLTGRRQRNATAAEPT